MPREHARTEENRRRSQHSMVYRGFQILWHPDSWEFSYVPRSGTDAVFLGAQFSVRKAIDRELDGDLAPSVKSIPARPSSSRMPTSMPRVKELSAAAQLLEASSEGGRDLELSGGESLRLREVHRTMRRWRGELPTNFRSVPNKPAVDFEGVCLYPELAVVAGLRKRGWDARWRKNFGGHGWWVGIDEHEELPEAAARVVNGISSRARDVALRTRRSHRGGGIWDVVAWLDGVFLFAELKGTEPLNVNQLLWLEAALELGVPTGSFVIVRYKVA